MAKEFSCRFEDREEHSVEGEVEGVKCLKKLLSFVNSKAFCLKKMRIDLKKKNNYFEKIIQYFHLVEKLESTAYQKFQNKLDVIYKIERINSIFMSEFEGNLRNRKEFFTKDKVKSCNVKCLFTERPNPINRRRL